MCAREKKNSLFDAESLLFHRYNPLKKKKKNYEFSAAVYTKYDVNACVGGSGG